MSFSGGIKSWRWPALANVLEKLRASSKLVKNSAWNLSGQLIPLSAALLCIPVLIEQLGSERFGFLAVAWMIIGYFSLFDFGLGRAVTYSVAKRNAEGVDSSSIIHSALSFLLVISVLVSAVIYLLSGYIVSDVLTISESLLAEATAAMEVLCIGLPFVILTIGLRGVLEAYQDFKQISLISMPSGALLFAAPLLAVYIDNSLVAVFTSLVCVRAIQFLLFVGLANRRVAVSFVKHMDTAELKALLTFGGWMTVTSVVSPIMVNMDRFFIGAKLSMGAVTSYVVPFDLISKAVVLPGAMSAAMFPEFAKRIGENKLAEALALLRKSMFILAAMLLPPLLIVYLFSYEILSIWISAEFSEQSFLILKILCVGVLFNGLAYLPFAFIQGAGRSDITAKIHIVELVLYLPALLYFLDDYGVVGAAYAWSARTGFDLMMLLLFAFTRDISR